MTSNGIIHNKKFPKKKIPGDETPQLINKLKSKGSDFFLDLGVLPSTSFLFSNDERNIPIYYNIFMNECNVELNTPSNMPIIPPLVDYTYEQADTECVKAINSSQSADMHMALEPTYCEQPAIFQEGEELPICQPIAGHQTVCEDHPNPYESVTQSVSDNQNDTPIMEQARPCCYINYPGTLRHAISTDQPPVVYDFYNMPPMIPEGFYVPMYIMVPAYFHNHYADNIPNTYRESQEIYEHNHQGQGDMDRVSRIPVYIPPPLATQGNQLNIDPNQLIMGQGNPNVISDVPLQAQMNSDIQAKTGDPTSCQDLTTYNPDISLVRNDDHSNTTNMLMYGTHPWVANYCIPLIQAPIGQTTTHWPQQQHPNMMNPGNRDLINPQFPYTNTVTGIWVVPGFCSLNNSLNSGNINFQQWEPPYINYT